MKKSQLRDLGFARIALAIPKIRVADCDFNADQIIELVQKAERQNVDVLLFPELCLTGYTAADLFQQETLLKKSSDALQRIIDAGENSNILIAVGMPIACDGQIFNCAVLIQGKSILGVIPKTYIPNYKEFYEERWFASARNATSREIDLLGQKVPFGTDLLFRAANFPEMVVGVEICEDLWVTIPPSSYQALAGATLLLNLSASNSIIGKADYRKNLVSDQSAKCIAAYAYCSCGVGESTTDVVFDGHAMIAENGTILAESERFSRSNQLIFRDIDFARLLFDRRKLTSNGDNVYELGNKKFRTIDFYLQAASADRPERVTPEHPFIPFDSSQRDRVCEEIFSIQVSGLAKRLEPAWLKKAVIGISGGSDSTLALLVAVKAFDELGLDRKNIFAYTMPGFATSERTRQNAIKLCRSLGVTLEEIDIKDGCLQQFKDIDHDEANQNVVFENVQARYRTMILFNKANQLGGLVLGTGDLSEIALGWCTFGGDHLSHYNVNASIPKTLIKYLISWVAETQVDEDTRLILQDILSTPVSPELTSEKEGKITQKTEDIIGPYELHDFFLYYLVRWGMSPKKILFLAEHAFDGKYSVQEIKKWLKLFIQRFFNNQWKRSCMPDGPKVGSVSLSPRGDWRMPSDAECIVWLEELQNKEEL